jgi:hypothetical protein
MNIKYLNNHNFSNIMKSANLNSRPTPSKVEMTHLFVRTISDYDFNFCVNPLFYFYLKAKWNIFKL